MNIYLAQFTCKLEYDEYTGQSKSGNQQVDRNATHAIYFGSMEDNSSTQTDNVTSESSRVDVGFPEVGRTKKKNFGVFILVALAVIIAAFFVYSLVWGGGESSDKFVKDEASGVTTTEEQNKVEPTPTIEAKKLDKKDVKVSILNGSGIPGSASVLQKRVEALGFSNIETGNADSYDYKTTKVSFSPTVSDAIREELTKELKKTYENIDTEEKTVSGFDIQIVIGGSSSKTSPTPTVKNSPTPTKATTTTPSTSPSVTPTL